MFKNYLTITFRNMARHKAITIINLAGLVLGITAFLLIMIWVGYELSFDKYHHNKDSILRLCVDFEAGNHMIYPMSMPNAAPNLVDDFPEIENAARLSYPARSNLKIGNDIFQETGVCHGDNSLFEIFSFPLLVGDRSNVLLDPYSVVISQKIAEKYFPDTDPLGESMLIGGEGPYKITGIFHDIPQNSHFRFDVVASFSTLYEHDEAMMNNWFHIQFYTYLLLTENTDYKELEAKLPIFVEKHLGETLKAYGAKLKFFLQPLTSIHLYSDLAGDIAPQADINYLYLFMGIALFVLLIACINFINLATANSSVRAKEVGMRKTIGSNRRQIIMQFLLESVVLCFAAMLISVSLVEIIRPHFSQIFGTFVDLDFLDNYQIFGIIVIIPVIIGIFAGSYPAVFISGLKPAIVLKSGLHKIGKKTRLRSVLVVFQFAISIILIIATLIMFKQINYMKYSDPGFRKDSMIVIPAVSQITSSVSLDLLKEKLAAIPGIEAAGFSSLFPGRGTQKAIMYPEGFAEDEPQMGEKLFIDADFLPTMGIEIIQGRNFSSEISTDPQQSVIINEAAASRFGWQNALGKNFKIQTRNGESRKMKVVGVVQDFHSTSLHNAIEPIIIYYDTNRINYLTMRITSSDIEATIKKIKQQIKKLAPNYVMSYYFLDETLNSMYSKDQQTGKLALYFSVLSIILGCLGLLGLTSFLVQNRTKEIGIRKVLGSSVAQIVLLLSKEYCKLVVISMLIAWPAAWYIMQYWLQNFAYRVDLGLTIFAVSGLFALVISIFTVSSQTIKTARANPVKALKYE